MSTKVNTAKALAFSERVWEQEIIPALCEYIRIPNKSPSFDPAWHENGHMDRAAALIEAWCRKQPIPGLKVEVVRLEGRTPVLLMEVPGKTDDTVLLYGHLDKQPEMVGWREGLAPWEPVREGDLLYGRGGADDGYSSFASLAALRLLHEQGIPHARCVVLIEGCEESGSPDLPAYIDALADRIGKPSLVVCLDSGCGTYDQLWTTTSLRGLIQGTLEVKILREGVHSGLGSGVAASSFRILRQLLSRVEDPETGRVLVEGTAVKLTSHEYRLLSYLMHHTGRIVSRGELTEHLYDQDFDRDSNTIEVFIGRLRKKLGVDIIQTVRGLGYLLDGPKGEG